MSNQTIQIDQLDTVIQKMLNEYGDDVIHALGETADEITTETAKRVKQSAPVDTGGYKKKIAAKKEHNKKLGDVHNYVHVKDPDYRRAHLLENGHACAGGTKRVPGKPHFKDGEDYVLDNFEKKLAQKVEDIR